MDPSYHPFVYYTWCAFIFEIIVFWLSKQKAYVTLGFLFNFYAVSEFYLLTCLFHRWGLFNKNRALFYSIIVFSILVWLAMMIFTKGFFKINRYFAIAYSFALIFFCISSFNKMVIQERRNILSNAKFWICIGIIIFYTYFLITNTVRVFVAASESKEEIVNKIQNINVYSNLLVNLLYAIALLWIPRKKNFITL